MSDEIFFDGKRYISAAEASSSSDLTRDYISKLCRDGKVSARRVRKNWYVENASLRAFLVGQEYAKTLRRESLSHERSREYRAHDVSASVPSRPSPAHNQSLRAASAAFAAVPIQVAGAAKAFAGSSDRTREVVGKMVSEHSERIVRSVGDSLKSPGIADAAARIPTAIASAAQASVHVSAYTVTPVVEFMHKLVALTLAFMLTFGTYALVDPTYARFAADSIREAAQSVHGSYMALTSGGAAQLAARTDAQLALAAENPGQALAIATYGIVHALPQAASALARALNSNVNRLVYAIAFPDALVRSTNTDSRGAVAIDIKPYARGAGAAPASVGAKAARVVATAPAGKSGGTTIVNQPVIERVVQERVLAAGGISEDILNERLQELDNKLSSKIYAVTAVSSLPASGGFAQNIAVTQHIDHLSGVAISGGTISGAAFSGGSIDGASISATSLSVSGATSLATTSIAGDLSVTGNLSLTGTTSSLSVANALITNGTTTNATSTNFFASNASTTNASTTNSYISNLAADVGAITGLSITRSTTTSATSTNIFSALADFTTAFVGTFSATIASITGLTVTNSTTTNATTTRSYIGTLAADSAAITNLVATNATTTNATTTNQYVSGGLTSASSTLSAFTFGSATGTNATSTNLFSATASSTNLYSTNGSIGVLSAGTLAISSTLAVGGLSTFAGFISSASSTIGNGTQAGGLTISGGATTTGNQYIAGNLTVGGNAAVVGNSTSDTITINSAIKSNLVPDQNATYDLGSASYYWRNAYVGTINANNLSAASSSISGTNAQTFTINAQNATADTQDMNLVFYRGTVVPNAVIAWNSALGAKRFEFNQATYIANQSGSTTQPTLKLMGVSGQTGNIFEIASSAGSTLFSVGPSGATTVGGSLTVNGALTTTQQASTTLFSSLGPAYFGSTATTTIDQAGNVAVAGNLQVNGTTNFTGLFALNNASTSQLSVFQKAYFGGTATTTIDSAGNIAGAGTLSLAGTTGTTTIASGQGFTIGGSQFVLQQGSGNVGIGTASPGAKLEAVTNVRASLSGTPSWYTELGSNGSASYLNTGGYANLSLQLGGVEKFRVAGSGSNILAGNLQLTTSRVSGVSDTAYIDLYNPSTGNIHIANTSASASVGNILFETGAAATEQVRITNAGNVGIGTSTPWGKLSVTGAGTGTGVNFLLADSANSPIFKVLDNGSITATGAFTSSATTANTFPYASSTALTVSTHCVAADTRLRRRRKARKGEEDDADEDGYIYEDVMIKDIEEGDEVQTLDQKTGAFTWSRVKGVVYTGIQPLIRITTESGRTIRTTAVHPYLMRTARRQEKQSTQKLYRFEVDQSVRFDEYGRDTFIALANSEQSFAVAVPRAVKRLLRDTLPGTAHRKTLAAAMFGSAIALLIRAKGVRVHQLIVDTEYSGEALEGVITAILKGVDPSLDISFKPVGKHSPAHKAAYSTFKGARASDMCGGTDTLFAQIEYLFSGRPLGSSSREIRALPVAPTGGESAALRLLRRMLWESGAVEGIKTENALCTALYGYLHPAHHSPQALLVPSSVRAQDEFVKKSAWVRADKLKKGHEIAVARGNTPAWERVVKIEEQRAESVFDIEVEGTHNFVANGIVAHNTYLLGQTDLANASTSQLSVFQKAYFGGTATTTIDSAGNIAGAGTLSLAGTTGTTTIASGQGFTIGGSQFVLQQGSGNVGIGTASPGAKLDVVGNTYVHSGTLFFDTVRGYTNGNMTFNNGSDSPLMTILNSGNVGIGTTSPSGLLAVQGTSASQPLLYLRATADIGSTPCLLKAESSSGNSLLCLSQNPANTAGNLSGLNSITGNNVILNSASNAAGSAINIASQNFTIGYDTVPFITSYTNKPITFRVGDPGTEKIRMDSSGRWLVGYTADQGGGQNLQVSSGAYISGNVGIGTTNPGSLLQVSGSNTDTQPLNGGGAANTVRFQNTSNTTNNYFSQNFISQGGTIATAIGTQFTDQTNAYGDIFFHTRSASGYTEKMRITSAGNVGIGTTSPATTLSVAGSGYLTGGLGVGVLNTTAGTLQTSGLITGGTTLALSGTSGTTTLASGQGFTIGGSQFVLQQGSGNVGIGTASPSANLEVRGTTASFIGKFGDGTNTLGLYTGNTGTFTGGLLTTMTNVPLGFSTNQGSGAMVITTAGNVGIGAVTLDAGLTTGLQTHGAIYSDLSAKNNFVLGATGANYGFISNQNSTTWSLGYGSAIGTLATPVLNWNSSGNVGIGNTSPSGVGTFGSSGTGLSIGAAGARIVGPAGAGSALDLIADGTNAYGVRLSVANTIGTSDAVFQGYTPSTGHMVLEDYSGAGLVLSTGRSGSSQTPILFYTNNGLYNERMRMNASGNVSIGNTNNSYKLDVSGFINTDGTTGGYKQAGNTILYASSTNFSTAVGQGAGINFATIAGAVNNTALGYGALGSGSLNATADYNTAIGVTALLANTSGTQNTAVAQGALAANTTGNYNTSLGVNALSSNTTGSQNVAIGVGALSIATSTGNQIAVGYGALQNSATGADNTAVGYLALNANTYGSQNTAFGKSALAANTTGFNNGAFGWDVLDANTTGSYNMGFGLLTLHSNTTGQFNNAFGYGALNANTTGSNNVALGTGALQSATSSNSQVAIGFNALQNSATGVSNLAIGYNALNANTYGSYNVGVGESALAANTTGAENTGMGVDSLFSNTTGYQNTAFGAYSMYNNTTGFSNVALGKNTLYYNGSATNTIAIGQLAGQGTSAYSSQGSVAIGTQAGRSFSTGSDYNTLLGYQSGYNVTSGSKNINIGSWTTTANANVTTGSNNIIIGNDIQAPSATASNQLNIGNLIFGTGLSGTGSTIAGNVGIGTTTPGKTLDVNGTMALQSPTISTTGDYLCWNTTTHEVEAGTSCTLSSEKFKTDIVPLGASLAKVLALQPVSFKFIPGYGDNGSTTQLGFIAEQAATVDRNFVTVDASGAPNGFVYANFTAVLTKAVQEQQAEFDALAGAASSTLSTGSGQAASFASAFFSNLFARLTSWFADAANGIGDFFANVVHTKKICLSDESGASTCVTKTQLDAMLAGQTAGAAGAGGNSSSGGVSSGAASTTSSGVPVIQINGNNPATISLGAVYADLGASITGPTTADTNLGIQYFVDGALMSTVQLDTATSSTHTIDYVATNSFGTATSTRTVIVGTGGNSSSTGGGVSSGVSTSTTPTTTSTSTTTSTTATASSTDSTATPSTGSGQAASSTTSSTTDASSARYSRAPLECRQHAGLQGIRKRGALPCV